MKYHQSNKKDVTPNLQLAKFDWSVVGYYHNLKTGDVLVNVLMEKDGAENQREFSITTPAAINEQTIIIEILKLTAFKGSKPI